MMTPERAIKEGYKLCGSVPLIFLSRWAKEHDYNGDTALFCQGPLDDFSKWVNNDIELREKFLAFVKRHNTHLKGVV